MRTFLMVLVSLYPTLCYMHGTEIHLSPQRIHQFETADIVLFGKDVTNIKMCPVVECSKNYNCSMDNSTMEYNRTMANDTELCKLICSSYDEPCDTADRRYMTFRVLNVLRDNGWKINQTIQIGPDRLAKANEVTRFDGTKREMPPMFVFIKKMINETTGMHMTSYDWSEDMSFSASYILDSEDKLNNVDFSDVCGLNQDSIRAGVPKYIMCKKACEAWMFRSKDKCYKTGTSMMTYVAAEMFCNNSNSKLAMLDEMSVKTVKRWFGDGSKYWAKNKADPGKDTTLVRWNETMWSDSQATPVVAEKNWWRTYDMQNPETALPLCQKDAKPNMPMMIADRGYLQLTLSPTYRKYSVCCHSNVVLPQKMFPGMMKPMKNVTAAYFENEPQVHLNNSAPKSLIILSDCTGDNPEYGSQHDPFIISMVSMDDKGSINTIWSYLPKLPMEWMGRHYQMYVYEITTEPDPTGYGGMTHSGYNCSAEPNDRCYFKFKQFQFDYNLTPYAIYSWRVWPDISTAKQLFAMRDPVNGSKVCSYVYPTLKDKVNVHTGLLLCDAPVGNAGMISISAVALFGVFLVCFM